MPRRANEREPAAPRRFDRSPGGERRSLERRLARDGVGIEPHAAVDRAHLLHVLARVYKKELLVGRCAALAPDMLVLEEDGEPLRPLGMVAGRVQARERGMGQDVDRTISASVSSSPPARPSR